MWRRKLSWPFLGFVCLLSGVTCTVRVITVDVDLTPDQIVLCHVERDECATGFIIGENGLPECNAATVRATRDVTACYTSNVEDAAHACQRYCRRPTQQAGLTNMTGPMFGSNSFFTALYDMDPGPSDGDCSATVVTVNRAAVPGECGPIRNVASNGPTALARCTVGGRICTSTAISGNTIFCQARAPMSEDNRPSNCFDPTIESASRFCGESDFVSRADPQGRQFDEPWIHLSLQGQFFNEPGVVLNFPACTTTQASPLLSYGVGAGSLGTAVHGNDSFALNATGGFMTFQGGCDPTGEFCNVSQLTDMRVTLSDTIVSGATVSNVEGRLRVPAAITVVNGVRKIARQNFDLQLSATILGGPAQMRLFPSTDVTVNLNNQTASLSFSATFDTSIPELGGIPVNVTASIPASTANPGTACAGFSRLQALMGFEDLGWTSTQAQLSLSASQHTQGCFALNVTGSGYMTLNSARFETPAPGVTPTLKLDVFVPPGQPNPNWLGAVQLYASCPSGGLYNAYLGQAELTGLPTGTFSTVSYAVPANVQSTLSGTHNDCFFSVAVNVNQTPTPVILDSLRFSQ